MTSHRGYRFVFRAVLIFTYLLLVAPVVVVVLVSFNPVESLTINLSQPTLRWYAEFFRNANFRDSFVTSLQIATLAAIGSTLLGTPVAYGLVRSKLPGATLLQTFFLSPIMVPAIILGVALLNLYFILGIKGSLISIVLAHVVITSPYVVRTVSSALIGLDPAIEEAAVGLGASGLRTFFAITLPLIRSGVIAGAVFVFIISFSELNATVFLTAPQVSTLPVQIFAELFWMTNPVVASASVFQILIITAGVLIIEYAVGITEAARF